jgi:hypothetical protein
VYRVGCDMTVLAYAACPVVDVDDVVGCDKELGCGCCGCCKVCAIVVVDAISLLDWTLARCS